jgi:hypothetical protein
VGWGPGASPMSCARTVPLFGGGHSQCWHQVSGYLWLTDDLLLASDSHALSLRTCLLPATPAAAPDQLPGGADAPGARPRRRRQGRLGAPLLQARGALWGDFFLGTESGSPATCRAQVAGVRPCQHRAPLPPASTPSLQRAAAAAAAPLQGRGPHRLCAAVGRRGPGRAPQRRVPPGGRGGVGDAVPRARHQRRVARAGVVPDR